MKLFQYWDTGDPPAEVAGWIEGFRSGNPGMTHTLYDRERASGFIGEHLGQRELRAFEACAAPAMQADYFRLCALKQSGGLALDADFRCLRPLAPLLKAAPGGLATLMDGQIVNGFVLAPGPGNPFIEACLHLATLNIEARDIPVVFTATGPGVLSAIWAILKPKEGRRLLSRFDNHLQRDWLFERVVERARREIAITEALTRAFDALTLLPKRDLLTWVAKTDPAYKQTERHWLNWPGSIYRDGAEPGTARV